MNRIQKKEAFPTRTPHTTGFTITEILVSTAILTLMSVLMFSSLNAIIKTISSEQSKMKTYSEARGVIDAMARENQQAMSGLYPITPPDRFADCYIVRDIARPSSELHFLAVLDNNNGNEEVEVHYFYDGSNTLYKAMEFGKSYSTNNYNWDFSTNPEFWYRTPSISPLSMNFFPVLNGVSSMTYNFHTISNDQVTQWPAPGYALKELTYSNYIPAQVEIKLNVFDSNIIRIYGTATNAIASNPSLTNLLREFKFNISVPRSQER